MKILLTSAEVDPFAKVGGLADVAGSLPVSLKQLGVDVRILMPHYGFIDTQRFDIRPLFSFPYLHRTGVYQIEISEALLQDVPVYFLRAPWFFGEEPAVYGDWNFDMPRFVFFNQAIIAFMLEMEQRFGWLPDVVHVNDWHTGLTPFLIDEQRQKTSSWAHIGTMMSIHNIAYQGDNCGGWCWDHGVPERTHPELVARGLTNNMLATGLIHSDIITTVSPRYAVEIQFAYQGYGLHELLRIRTLDLYGILNGIDTVAWDPAIDGQLVSRFDADTFVEARPPNKHQLQIDAGLTVREDVFLIGMVSRLVWQKGIDLALPALRRLMEQHDVQFVGLGTGEKHFNDEFYQLGSDFQWKAKTFVGFHATIANRIYAGCDLFLMPSHYEPCGIGQMLAMRYGALPLVRDTGGLADTVTNFDNDAADQGTGFIFQTEDVDAVYNTLVWAMQTYQDKRAAWQRMQERAMRMDFSWERSARDYITLYDKIVERRT
ncbi:MAG: glycogen synthase [Anaerolineae bacterium]|nr:glycogen synthase [Anaerolineae bacterium]